MIDATTIPNISSITTVTTTIKITGNARWKDEFIAEVLATKNDSSNSLLFTSHCYNQTIELINSAKQKRYSDRSEQILLLKTYDVFNAGN